MSHHVRTAAVLSTLLIFLAALAAPLHAADVPIQGSGRGSVTGVEPVADGLEMSASSSGRSSQLGSFTRTEVLVLDPATGRFTGEAVFTAANGDELHALVTGIFVSPTTAAGTYTFDGGSGRFEQASGEAAFVVYTSDGVHFKVLFRGTVSSVGQR
jgi:hypothetical protein